MILKLDFASKVPLFMQIRNQIVIAIADGSLKPGERLPTIRNLAEESGLNMMTISKAYQQLTQEGYLITDRRNGAMVANKETAHAVDDALLERMRLCISELRLAGMSPEEIRNLCDQLYGEQPPTASHFS